MRQPPAGRTTILAAAVMAATATAAGQNIGSPFGDLVGTPGLSWSNDRFSISIHWTADAYSITLPGLPPFTHNDPVGAARHWSERSELRIGCRAGNGRPGYGVAPAEATASIPRHPDLPSPYNITHPMFWILGITGNDIRRTPLNARLNGREAPGGGAVLETPLVYDLEARLPHEITGLPARRLLGLLAAGRPLQLDAAGEKTTVRIRFAATAELAAAARTMLEHCPQGARTSGRTTFPRQVRPARDDSRRRARTGVWATVPWAGPAREAAGRS